MNTLFSAVRSARRFGQTSLVLQKTGLQWMFDKDRSLAKALRGAMEELGTTYIKLGQLIASSPSLFPHEYVEAFQDCLDQSAPLPYSVIEQVLKQELGDSMNTEFQFIDSRPLASASIAQVHAAKLKTGEDVVIKVQRPGVQNLLETDFQFLSRSIQFFELFSPSQWHNSISDIVAEIRDGMMEECDFLLEAENIRAYDHFLQTTKNTHVVVPRVYEHVSTSRVLTMERFYGVALTDVSAVQARVQNPQKALVDALDTWYESLRKCQIYHADLHAGNVLLLDDGRVAFIDFGIVGRMSPQTWGALQSLVKCVPAMDFKGIAQALVQIGMTERSVDTEHFARQLESLYKSFTEENEDPNQDFDEYMKQLTVKISSISRDNGIRFPREFTLLVKQVLYFDRYISLLAPDLELFPEGNLIFG